MSATPGRLFSPPNHASPGDDGTALRHLRTWSSTRKTGRSCPTGVRTCGAPTRRSAKKLVFRSSCWTCSRTTRRGRLARLQHPRGHGRRLLGRCSGTRIGVPDAPDKQQEIIRPEGAKGLFAREALPYIVLTSKLAGCLPRHLRNPTSAARSRSLWPPRGNGGLCAKSARTHS